MAWRALGQDGGRHAVAGLVDQVAGEVLRLADDAALLHRGASAISRSRLVRSDDEFVDLLVLAVALVVVGIEVADERAFDHRLDGVCQRQRRRRDEARSSSGLSPSDCAPRRRRACATRTEENFFALPPPISSRRLAFSPCGLVQQRGLQHLAGDLAGGDEFGGGREHGLVVGLDLGVVLSDLSPLLVSQPRRARRRPGIRFRSAKGVR